MGLDGAGSEHMSQAWPQTPLATAGDWSGIGVRASRGPPKAFSASFHWNSLHWLTLEAATRVTYPAHGQRLQGR